MSEIAPLNIKVNLDTSTVTVGVAKATAGLEQISAKAKSTTNSFAQFKSMALGVFGGNLLTSGIMGVNRVFADMKAESIATEAATSRLSNAMQNMTGLTEKQKTAVINNANAYSTLGFEGSEAIRAMGTLVTATGDVTQANKLMSIAADYARDKHIDMDTAAIALARATTGNMKAFTAYGITLDKTLPKNKAIAKAFDELNTKIGGQAVAYTKTFAGRMDVMREQFQQIGDTIANKVLPIFSAFLGYIINNGKALAIYGGIVLTTIGIIKTYGAVTAAIKSIQQAYAFWTYAQAASTNVLRFAVSSLWTTMKANPIGFITAAVIVLGVAFVAAWNKFEGFRKFVMTAIQQIVQGFGYLIGGTAKVIRALSYLPGMKGLRTVADDADKAAISMGKYAKTVYEASNKKITVPKIPGFSLPGSTTGIKGNANGGGGGGGGGTGQKVAPIPGSAEWMKEQAGNVTYIYNINTTANTNASPKLIADSTVTAIKYGKPITMTVPKADK